MTRKLREALDDTLGAITVKLSCAQSYMESDEPDLVIAYIKEIHQLSHVGERDYGQQPAADVQPTNQERKQDQ